MDEERLGKYFKPTHVYIPIFKLNRMLDYCKLLNFPSLNIFSTPGTDSKLCVCI